VTDYYRDSELGRRAGELQLSLEPYFDAIEERLYMKFKTAPIRDEEGMVLLRLQHHALGLLKQELETVITTGKFADVKLSEEENSNA